MSTPVESSDSHHSPVIVGNETGNQDQEKTLSRDQVGDVLEMEHNLTFLDVCSQYPKIVVWSFFWCMTAVACTR